AAPSRPEGEREGQLAGLAPLLPDFPGRAPSPPSTTPSSSSIVCVGVGALLGDTRPVLSAARRRSVSSWCRRNTIGGDGAVAARPRSQGSDPQPLSRAQELDLIEQLRGRWPEEFGIDEPLWSRRSVATLVERLYGLTLSTAEVGYYLRAWGIWARQPTDRACALCADAVARWVQNEYPAIVRSAREHHAELHWVGRTRLHGVTPAAAVLSAVSTRGQIRFMIVTPTVDPPLP